MTHGIPPRNRTTTRRTKSIGTKLTAEEYDEVVRVADGHTLSEWVRDVLLGIAAPKPADQVLLAEILALRTILLNLQFAVASGDPLTTDAMKRLIERADQAKTQRAADRLVTAMPRR